jgi:hypothetical protein
MRIAGSSRAGAPSYAALGRRAGGAEGFSPAAEAAARPVAAAGPVGVATEIEALLALQAVDDALFARRKAVRRGHQLLDALDGMKAELLIGHISEGRLNQLLALVGEARQRTLPGLDAVLDGVELRARVELAKYGRFAAA